MKMNRLMVLSLLVVCSYPGAALAQDGTRSAKKDAQFGRGILGAAEIGAGGYIFHHARPHNVVTNSVVKAVTGFAPEIPFRSFGTVLEDRPLSIHNSYYATTIENLEKAQAKLARSSSRAFHARSGDAFKWWAGGERSAAMEDVLSATGRDFRTAEGELKLAKSKYLDQRPRMVESLLKSRDKSNMRQMYKGARTLHRTIMPLASAALVAHGVYMMFWPVSDRTEKGELAETRRKGSSGPNSGSQANPVF